MAKSKAEKRQDEILRLLNSNDVVSIAEFCDKTNCSESTIRNDLTRMENEGLLRRTFGGAVKTDTTPYNLKEWSRRETIYLREKQSIADYVVENMIMPNSTIILDAGTTCYEVARKVVEKDLKVTVLTNSARAAFVLMAAPSKVDLYLFGGMYNNERGTFYDEYQFMLLEKMRANLFLMSINGISEDLGLTILGGDEAQTKIKLMEISAKTIVLADHSKIGHNSLKYVAKLSDIQGIVTDEGLQASAVDRLSKQGIDVLCAPYISE